MDATNGWGNACRIQIRKQQVDGCGMICDVDTTMDGLSLCTLN